MPKILLFWAVLATALQADGVAEKAQWQASVSWKCHVIDDSLQGADGVKLADVDSDGRLDIATGWEESGAVRIYFQPEPHETKRRWPTLTLHGTPSVEDAAWVDVNADGQWELLSCTEGQDQQLRLHSFAGNPRQPSAWQTQSIAQANQMTRWMFAQSLGSRQVVVGSKDPRGMLGLLTLGRADANDSFKLVPLTSAQWIMSIRAVDINDDGQLDIVYSDRKGTDSGIYALLGSPNGHEDSGLEWRKVLLGCLGREVMFLDIESYTKHSAVSEIVAAVKTRDVFILRTDASLDASGVGTWSESTIRLDDRHVGTMKAVRFADLDLDGSNEIVVTCEGATGDRSGVFYLRNERSHWIARDISGPAGIKFDRIEVLDLDADGDLDVLTCEERFAGRGLGVIWYENPLR
ncbi:MAG: VCBS repeat-containing protein [Pirellulaceae bacterium]